MRWFLRNSMMTTRPYSYSSFTEEDRLLREGYDDDDDDDDDDDVIDDDDDEQGFHRIVTTPCRPRFWKTTFGSVLFMTLILLLFPGRLIWIAQLLLGNNNNNNKNASVRQPHHPSGE
jgi:hypothetical protein